MDLKGFEAYDMRDRPIAFSITENGITFNASAAKAIGYPEYATLYVNKEDRLLLLMASDKYDDKSKAFFTGRRKNAKVKSVRWNSESLNRDVIDLIEGDKTGELCVSDFRVRGRKVDVGKDHPVPAVLFDLKVAKQIL